MKYFLRIDGLNGGSSDPGHSGWFDLDGFEVDLSNTTGTTTFAPLVAKLNIDPALAAMLKYTAGLNPIQSIRIEGVSTGGQPVYDLTLAGATITQLQERSDGTDAVNFSYQQLGLLTQVQNTQGGFSAGPSFGWDLVKKLAIDPNSLPAPTAGNGSFSVPPTKYFLAIDGLDGGSTDAGHAGWFDLSSFELDLSNTTGKTAFPPLVADLNIDPALAGALKNTASMVFRSIKIEGVTAAGQAVYDLTLAGALVMELQEHNAGADSVSFGYQQLGLLTQTQNAQGAFLPGPSFGWDVVKNRAIDPNSLPAPTPGSGPVSVTPSRYFLAIDGLYGGSIDDKHAGWFDLSSFDINLSNSNSTGKTEFTPLRVNLNIDSALAGALKNTASIKPFQSIKIEGVTAQGQAVYDVTLAGATITQLQEFRGGATVSFSYQQLGLLTQTQNVQGGFTPGPGFGWDITQNKLIDPNDLPAPLPRNGPPSVTPTKYFLAIDGLDGGSTDAGHAGWFDLSSFELDLSNTTGKTAFPPLVADLNIDPALAGALKNTASMVFRSIKIEGVTAAGQAVYDLTLAGALVMELQEHNAGADSVSFGYQQLGLLTQTQNAQGAFLPGPSFGWDVVKNRAIDPNSLPAPTPGSGPVSVTPSRYFLAIDGLYGGSIDDKHAGWFDLSSFDIGVSNNNTSGKTAFLPLETNLNIDPSLAGALNHAARAQPFQSIKIEGVTAQGQAVYDLTLTAATITHLQELNGGTAVSFTYQQLGLLTQTQNVQGGFTPGPGFGWDITQNKLIDPNSLPAPTPGSGSMSVLPTKYFLAIDGLDGGSTDARHAGWFDLSSFNLDLSNTTGVTVFAPLVASLNVDPAVAGALADIANGSQLKSIKIEGVTASGKAVYDLTLADVTLTQLQERNGGSDSVSFAYGRLGLLTQTQKADGTFAPGPSFGWDVGRNLRIDDPSSLPAPTPGVPIANHAPVVTPVSGAVTVSHSHPVAASTLFTTTDPDGDPIVQYDFWDNGSAAGTWLLNGNPLLLGMDNFVSAAQLSQVTYRGGHGTETIWERATDGAAYSAWVSLNATDTAPVVTPTNPTANVGHGTIAATSLFTAGDGDADSIVQYDFWDSGQAGGHWFLNGNALPNNQENFVSAAQLSQVTYRGGSGSETIYERASDGIQYGAWVSVNATGTETAPVVTAVSPNVNVGHNPFAATSLVTTTDADGDAIVQYDFWDSGQAGGHWFLNGNALPNNQENFVSGAQLSQVTYHGGSGTETIYERASDGLLYSAWVSVTATGTETAPVVTPVSPNVNVGHNAFAATSLFTATDADADAIVQYDFWDSGQVGGHWFLNGNALPNNQENFVSGAQLSQVTYRGGSGTETIYERASDGILFSAWVSINATGTNTAPVVTPVHSTVSGANNITLAVSNLFTANDADGDPIVQYDFWNSGGGGGCWLLNGNSLTPNQDNFVDAAQLSQVSYRAGTSTDTIWMRASDGLQFGAWPQGLTVVDAPVANPTSNSVLAANGQTFAATSLFTASDADGDSLIQYDFWDTGSGGGRWQLNGNALGTNQDNVVNAAQLSQVTYKAGSGTDMLWVRVNDGSGFGPWSTGFTVSDPPQLQTVQAGETLEVTSRFSGSVTFASDTGTLKLDNSATFAGTVAGMTGHDTIDFTDIDPTKVQQPTYSGTASGGNLTVTDGTHSANIALLGNYLASTFVASSDGHGGTTVVDPSATGQVALLAQHA